MRMKLAMLAALLTLPSLTWADQAEVVGVLDGDTVAVLSPDRKMTRCRLSGIDAPEKGQAFGQASKTALSNLIYRKTLDVRVLDTDRYGRSVCKLTLAGVDINREQVARGMAWVYRRYNQDPTYYDAEAAAKAAKRGLWADASPVPPWEFRRAHADERQRTGPFTSRAD
ncbi:thermonuclease family protein [Paracidovorax citrulli]|uniref:thermonuclease family protein n=1 Tax=Paracidovorax citrulli TaxID=80869 RepID=UPI003FA6D2B8